MTPEEKRLRQISERVIRRTAEVTEHLAEMERISNRIAELDRRRIELFAAIKADEEEMRSLG